MKKHMEKKKNLVLPSDYFRANDKFMFELFLAERKLIENRRN